eukprot:c38830_g1_i1.p1 GENE.c38830_g1_i1~~c38830_g1_i1.p1  ORF type:complete len:374 (-),score=53.12 c38830_g1_i1:97-1218(-)
MMVEYPRQRDMAFEMSDAMRQVSNLSSMSATSFGSTGKRKTSRRAALWTEKNDSTTVVFGPLVTHESFNELLLRVKESCEDVKSHYYREAQSCGFVYFHSDAGAARCVSLFNSAQHDDNELIVAPPSRFFSNEEDACPETYKAQTVGVPSSAVARTVTHEPTATLVLKNLCFGLKQGKLLDFLTSLPAAPQSVSYHFDGHGLFRGVAFAKYNSVAEASVALQELSDSEFDGRKLKAEFKRRASSTPAATPPITIERTKSGKKAQVHFSTPTRLGMNRSYTGDSTDSPHSDARYRMQSSSTPVPISPIAAVKTTAPVSLFSSSDLRDTTPVIRDGLEFSDAEDGEDDDDDEPPALVSMDTDNPVPVLQAGREFE